MVDEAWGLDRDALKRMLGNVYGTFSNSLGTMLRHLKRASKPNDQQDNFRAMDTFLERVSESDDQQVNTEAMRALLERINDSQDSRLQGIQTAKLLLPLLEQGPKRNELLELLASHCYHQFNATNDWQSLEDALTHLGEVLEAATEVDVDYARWAVMYSKCLQARYMRGRNGTDLENAIDWAEKSTDLTRALLTEGAKIESLVRALGNLWHCLFTKVHQRNNTTDEDFEKMMSAAQDAVKIAVDNSLSIELLLETKNNLGMSYQFQWDRWDRWEERKYEDLDRSLQLGWEVVTAMRGLSSKANTSDALAMALSNHSFRLQRAYLCYVKDGSLPHKITVPSGQYLLDQAVDLLAESTTIPGIELLSALTNTLAFVTDIKNFPHEYRSGILGRSSACLHRSVYNLEKLCKVAAEEDRRNTLALFYGVSRYAAAAHLHLNGCPFEALRILEKGRGIAHAIHQDMHKGFRFPRDLSVQEMMSLAENEDIVVINITDLRSEAIIIRRDSVYSVHLPDLDEEVLSEKSWEIQSRLAKETDQVQVHFELHGLLTDFFRHLWRNLVEPVMNFLGYSSSPESLEGWPHIRWIPTGVLCLYPIHAAGLGLHSPANTMNRVISTYATSLSSLHYIKQRQRVLNEAIEQPGNEQASGPRDPSVLIISMPNTPGQSPLALSHKEEAAIAAMFPSCQVRTSPETQVVMDALATEPKIVHFSCHGIVDYDFPTKSLLLTSDWETEPLTTARLQALNDKSSNAHLEPRLAFLSACFAANGGVENQQDENIHLASSMHHAGFSNVVGSTWYVEQGAALAVVEGFYKNLGGVVKGGHIDGRQVAEALHFAVLEYRDTTRSVGNRNRGAPLYWAPFICFTD